MLIALVSVTLSRWPHRRLEVRYTQLTDFTDSAVTPTLSPDGRMVAFIRGRDDFLTSDQIYVKMLPNGKARRVTDDKRPKYGVAFSPDGTEIAYTVLETTMFSSYAVSALGGESHLLLRNAARMLGNLAAGGISNLYYPAQDRAGSALMVDNALIDTGLGAFDALVEEFVLKKLTRGAPVSSLQGSR